MNFHVFPPHDQEKLLMKRFQKNAKASSSEMYFSCKITGILNSNPVSSECECNYGRETGSLHSESSPSFWNKSHPFSRRRLQFRHLMSHLWYSQKNKVDTLDKLVFPQNNWNKIRFNFCLKDEQTQGSQCLWRLKREASGRLIAVFIILPGNWSGRYLNLARILFRR